MRSSLPGRPHAVAVAGLLLLLTPVVAVARSAREEATREFSRTVPMRSGQALHVLHDQGDVVVRTHALAEARVVAHIRVSAPSATEASAAVQQVVIEIQETPAVVSVRTRYPQDRGARSTSYAVDYEIVMPETASLQARNSFGAFSASGLKADSNVRTSHGRLSFTDGKGRQRLENSFGAVEVARNEGDVTIANQNGAVKVADVQGALEVTNRFGSVEALRVRGGAVVVSSNGSVVITDAGAPSRITNSFGAVEASLIRGDLTVANSNGTVNVRNVAGTADLKTSFGALTFDDVGKGLVAVNSNGRVGGRKIGGSAEIRTSFGAVEVAQIQGDARVTNSNGAVTLRDAAGAAYLKSSFGLVQAERVGGSLQVENSNGAVRAATVKGSATVRTSFGAVVLGGVEGPVVEVRNQNGAVEVAGAAPRCTRIDLSTSFSAIRLRLPETGGYDITARTSFGSIHSELPITASGTLGGDSLSGRIGPGGCTVTLTGSNGSIEILRAGPAR